MSLQQSPHEVAMYRRGTGRAVLLVGVYVDDLIIVGADAEEVEKFKAAMKQRFDMSDLGLLSFYLGIEVPRTPAASRFVKHTTPSAFWTSATWRAATPPTRRWRRSSSSAMTVK